MMAKGDIMTDTDTNGWPKIAVTILREVGEIKSTVSRIDERTIAQGQRISMLPCDAESRHRSEIQKLVSDNRESISVMKKQWIIVIGLVAFLGNIVARYAVVWFSNKGGSP